MYAIVCINNNVVRDSRVKRQVNALADEYEHVHVVAVAEPDENFGVQRNNVTYSFAKIEHYDYPATPYLREQLKAIQKELGDDEDINSEADEYREKLNKIKAPKETKEKIAKEINKLSKISPMSPDVSVSRTYLDTVFSLPLNKETRDKIDLEKSIEILDD